MIDRTTKLRWRRVFRRKRRQMEDMGVQAEESLEKHFFKRLSNLVEVRRFVVSWFLLLTLLTAGSLFQLEGLNSYYLRPEPVAGGSFTEGIVGTFTGVNPLYATNAVDSAASRLVFSSLMKYDQQNKLVSDLAEDIKVDSRGVRYEVKLRKNVRWHDGQPLTAEDVVFTYNTIQNPDARSPLFNGWKGIKIEAPDGQTVVFTLPSALGAFPHSLTNGIVPKHVLAKVSPDQLRTDAFNTTSPVGSGPFVWDALEVAGDTQETREERIGLMPNQSFYGTPPALQRFIIRTFRDEQLMLSAYQDGELTGMVGLSKVPEELKDMVGVQEFNVPLAGEVAVFFKTTMPPFNDVEVRRSLVQAVDVPEAIRGLGYPVIAAKGPLLASHPGYNPALTQLEFDQVVAEKRLDKAKWKKGPDGIRQKGKQRLAFSLYAQSTDDYMAITSNLQKAWRAIGVEVEVLLQTDANIQAAVRSHQYEALLYGVSTGSDPDVFAYWHSSQADPRSPSRLNLSEYRSPAADEALEAGRTRSIPSVRAAKYQAFLKQWRQDAPALALYQPRFLYITRGKLFNFQPGMLNSVIDRYSNVENWMIREARVVK